MMLKKPEPPEIRGICIICDKRPQKKVASKLKYRAVCGNCERERYETPEGKAKRKAQDVQRHTKNYRPYRYSVKDHCEKCGFIPEHICQLDVDHIDGNHNNNSEENFQTLCANCHRLKTFHERKPR